MLYPHVSRTRYRYSRQEQIFLTLYAEFNLALTNYQTLYRILKRRRGNQKSPLSRPVDGYPCAADRVTRRRSTDKVEHNLLTADEHWRYDTEFIRLGVNGIF